MNDRMAAGNLSIRRRRISLLSRTPGWVVQRDSGWISVMGLQVSSKDKLLNLLHHVVS